MSKDWTEEEVALIIKDYFSMLLLELGQQKYNKTIHRTQLSVLLNSRSDGSIEFKHQNISAVLAEIGLPYIKGYKPRFNYQNILSDQILDYLKNHAKKLESLFEQFSLNVPEQNTINPTDFNKLLDDGPEHHSSVINESPNLYRPIKVNYLEKEQNNRILGEKGEELILQYEKWRLIQNGREHLANRVEWVSKNIGDGLGFDILSKNLNGTDRYIEVKTTKLTKETPIFLTRNEINFARSKNENFYLYRVFSWPDKPRFFMKQGEYGKYCSLEAINFRGFF